MKDKHIGYLIRLMLFVAVYFITARFGLGLNAVGGFATLVWPPTGIALAVILLYGKRMWPGIAIAAFLVNFMTGANPAVALGIACGNTLEALAGAYLLRRCIGFRLTMQRLKDVLGLIGLAGLLATMISATIGVTSLYIGGVVGAQTYVKTWLAWWVGDLLGVLVVTPLILLWTGRPWLKYNHKKLAEASGLMVLMVAACALVFRGFPELGIGPYTLAYVLFPLFVWIALRFGMRGSVTAMFIVSAIAIWGTVTIVKPPDHQALSYKLLLVQGFMGVTAITFMVMAAIVAEVLESQRLALALTEQRTRLLELNKSKDEFITLASHQLRTPATGVKLYLGMLLDGFAGKLAIGQLELVQTAYDSNERQLKVANALLNVARLDAGSEKIIKEKVDLVSLIANIIRDLSPTFEERAQKVKFKHKQAKYFVPGDALKLGVVVENVIVNASKYSHPGKTVTIRLAKDADSIIITVRDEGVGIPKHELKKLFKKFARIDNALSVDVGGVGLGLYWAKKVVDMHGGTISVVSEPEVGSIFSIALPVKVAP